MKYALVTGSTRGIGLAVSDMLIKKGFFVFMNYAHDDAAALAAELEPDRHCIIKADVSSPGGVDVLTDDLLGRRGLRLDCIVLNAGATCRKAFGGIGYEDFAAVMDANVNMPFFIVQKLSGVMSDSGNIIFIGSDMGIYPHAVSVPYGVSKAAVHMLAKSLVKEFAGRGIRVNAVSPGFIDTQWQKEKPQWLRKKIEGKIALRRFGMPDEVAGACAGIIENGYINGAVLRVDGGYDME